ncbi:MAG: fluoride efflux transporter CrcB [Gemmataceae bacterium]|nr:fluoride efflux transporter CrcB [Gemmataceae bacterium]
MTWTVFLHPAMLVGLGCAAGGVARLYLGKGVNAQPWADGFPWATGIINILGSFLLGILAELYLERKSSEFRHEMYLLLGTGFCGGFTTFSTFSLELLHLLRDNSFWPPAAYALGSVLLALAAAWLGIKLVQSIP